MGTVRGRPRGFDREAALDSALLRFWRHGYEATSIATLTEAMGINPPSLYAAFGDKRALFAESVERYLRTYGAFAARAFAEEPTARAAVGRLLHESAEHYTESGHPPGCLIIRSAVTCSPAAEDVRAALGARRRATRAAIADKIAADVAEGLLPPDTDPGALAAFYGAVLQGMSTQAGEGASREDLRCMADIAMRAWPS